jgi:hypothetical protein
MDCVVNAVSNSSSIVARELDAVGTCLFHGYYLVTGLHAALKIFLFVSYIMVGLHTLLLDDYSSSYSTWLLFLCSIDYGSEYELNK